jgi:Na+-transporting methylmalonyl-CoA/oxaloacetate decarboxylase gamma subunit
MAGRRLLLFVVLLIAIGAVANATVPREEDAPVRRPAPAPPAPEQAGPVANVVVARLPGRKDVRATVGDVVRVAVAHDAADVVQVTALGLSEPVEPGIDAELVFDADRAGRFAVTLRDAQRRVGTIDVGEAG